MTKKRVLTIHRIENESFNSWAKKMLGGNPRFKESLWLSMVNKHPTKNAVVSAIHNYTDIGTIKKFITEYSWLYGKWSRFTPWKTKREIVEHIKELYPNPLPRAWQDALKIKNTS